MTDNYLTKILGEAEHITVQHDQVAQIAANQAHEYLRYAALRILEEETNRLPKGCTPIDYPAPGGVYPLPGVPPGQLPRTIVHVMAALGAWRVWTGSVATYNSYDHCEYREVHYLWPEGYPVEKRHNTHP